MAFSANESCCPKMLIGTMNATTFPNQMNLILMIVPHKTLANTFLKRAKFYLFRFIDEHTSAKAKRNDCHSNQL